MSKESLSISNHEGFLWKKSWKVSNKCQIGSWSNRIHNFLSFGHTKKFFTNLEMADQVKINDIKRLDDICGLGSSKLFQKLVFKKILGKSD